jgi:cell division protein FtsN
VTNTKKPPIQMTKKQAAGWACILFLISASMFALGVFIGRGTAPVKFDTKKLEKELASLKEAVIKKEKNRFKINSDDIDNKIRLSFYEVLKETKKNFKVDPPANTKKASVAKPKKIPRKIVKSKKLSSPEKKMPNGMLTIQVASLKDRKTASDMIARLKKKGYSAYITKAEVSGKGTWYRIRIGSFNTREEAEKIRNRLKKDELSSILVYK